VSQDQMDIVSSEIVSAIHQIIVNGAALIALHTTLRIDTTLFLLVFYFLFYYFKNAMA
jgi:hypothetical protein